MYFVNTYRWDYPLLAALVAPRPLLISNSDKDRIFPLDGVVRLHRKVRQIYKLYDAEKNFGLHITEGPHKDTQELRIHAFVWFNRFLKNENPLIEKSAVPFFEPEQLKVFDELPDDQINTEIQESFVPTAPQPAVPQSAEEWARQRRDWISALRDKSFRGWPSEAGAGPLKIEQVLSATANGIRLRAFDFTSQPHVQLRLYLAQRANLAHPSKVVLRVVDEDGWVDWLGAMRVKFADQFRGESLPDPNESAFARHKQLVTDSNVIVAHAAPRGIGPTPWDTDERKRTHVRRRFMLLGQTLDGMRVWDVRRAIQTLRSVDSLTEAPLVLDARGQMAGVALYASLFEPDIARLNLRELPRSHRERPILLNVMRYLDMPQAVAMAAEHSRVRIYETDESAWWFPKAVTEELSWPDRKFRVVTGQSTN
jgi:hypothetical protein